MTTHCKGDKMKRLPIVVLILAVLVLGCQQTEMDANEKLEMNTDLPPYVGPAVMRVIHNNSPCLE